MSIFKDFNLRSGDKVWVNIIPKKGKLENRIDEIVGFSCFGIYYKNHPEDWHHYTNGLFYGFGYHDDGYVIVCKKKWHLYPAIVVEKIRLWIPEKWSIKLKLEK